MWKLEPLNPEMQQYNIYQSMKTISFHSLLSWFVEAWLLAKWQDNQIFSAH